MTTWPITFSFKYTDHLISGKRLLCRSLHSQRQASSVMSYRWCDTGYVIERREVYQKVRSIKINTALTIERQHHSIIFRLRLSCTRLLSSRPTSLEFSSSMSVLSNTVPCGLLYVYFWHRQPPAATVRRADRHNTRSCWSSSQYYSVVARWNSLLELHF